MIGLIIISCLMAFILGVIFMPDELCVGELKGWLWCQLAGREHRRQVRAILARRRPSDIADAVLVQECELRELMQSRRDGVR